MSHFAPMIRFRPYSHRPGVQMLLPGSWLSCQVFPAKIVVFDYSQAQPTIAAEIALEGFGLLERFMVVQDLEQGCIQVSGFSKDGFLRYEIIPVEDPRALSIRFVKVPQGSYSLYHPDGIGRVAIQSLQTFHFLNKEGSTPVRKAMPERERLFLGCSKAQDWDLVCRRLDMREILPVWYWLAQSIPAMDVQESVPLLGDLEHAVHEWKMHELSSVLLTLFQVGFKDLLVPRFFDDSYLGLSFGLSSNNAAMCSPLLLLQKSWQLIRQCFFIELPGHLYVLPTMPPQFHSGVLSRVVTSRGHVLTIEWTKQVVRRVWIEGGCDETVTFVFQKHLKHFRLKSHDTVTLPNCSEIALEKGKRLLFDHFEK